MKLPLPESYDRASVEKFIARWRASAASERANAQLFAGELCDVLGVELLDHVVVGDESIASLRDLGLM